MHDTGAPAAGEAPAWRSIVEKHHRAMADDLAGQWGLDLESNLSHAVSTAVATERAGFARELSGACETTLRSHAETLNQAIRRFRKGATAEEILHLLSEVSGPYAASLVVLVFEKNHARPIAGRSIDPRWMVPVDIEGAVAILSAIDSRDPVVTLSTGEQLSEGVLRMFNSGSEGHSASAEYGKTYLFPIVARQAVAGMLIASGDVKAAPLELLCEAAALRIESFAGKQPPETPGAGKQTAGKQTWDALSAGDQALHLQAQRMARVRVAEMRLYNEEALRRGLGSGDVYNELHMPIDTARRQFLQLFLAKSPTMVDYLHLEIVGNLVNGDDRLLGDEYPGPMV